VADRADCAGMTCLVTGATSGHGEAVAGLLARRGADMVLLGRSAEKCERVRRDILAATGRAPDVLLCDLSSLQDTKRAMAEFLSWKRPLHILINNAGQVNRYFQLTGDGIEETFAVNYLAMYHLTLLLLDRIIESAPARIVNVASDAHMIADLDLDDPEGRGGRYSMMGAYARSKLAVLHFTIELARILEGTGVTANAVDPGPVASGIAKKEGLLPRVADAIIQLTFPRPERAARTAVHLASSPELAGATGEYWRFMKPKAPKLSADPGFGTRLWELSARMAGVDGATAIKKN